MFPATTEAQKSIPDLQHKKNQQGEPIRRVAANTAVLFVSAGIVAVANLLVNLIIGRKLGAGALGIYAFAMAVSRIFYVGTELGIGTHLKRTLARDPHLAPDYVSLFVSFRLLLIPLAILITTGAGLLMGIPQIIVVALIAIAFGLSAIVAVHESLFIAHEDFWIVGLNRMFYATCLAFGCLWWYQVEGDLWGIGIVLLITYFLYLSAMWWCGKIRIGFLPRLKWNLQLLRSNIKSSFPIGLSMLMGTASMRLPVLVISGLIGIEETGQFAAVEMFIFAVTILTAAIANVSLPILSRAYGKKPATFRKTLWAGNAILAAVGITFALCFTLWGGKIIRLFFPQRDFYGLDLIAAVLGWSAPFLLPVHFYICVFAAANQEKNNTIIMFIGLIALGILELALVPVLGLLGAAIGVLIARIVVWVIIMVTSFCKGIY